jgi:hypothetical protein
VDLQAELDKIREGKDKSPRSKENAINKMKIEYMMRRIDTAFTRHEI